MNECIDLGWVNIWEMNGPWTSKTQHTANPTHRKSSPTDEAFVRHARRAVLATVFERPQQRHAPDANVTAIVAFRMQWTVDAAGYGASAPTEPWK